MKKSILMEIIERFHMVGNIEKLIDLSLSELKEIKDSRDLNEANETFQRILKQNQEEKENKEIGKRYIMLGATSSIHYMDL